jgi:PKD repeat protein
MKRSTILFLGLLTLVSLLLFNYRALLASPAADPSLTIGSATAPSLTEVVLPITFDSGGNNISSLVFSVDFDQALLTFDASDNNFDGIPDAIDFNVPPSFAPSATFDATDSDGELDFTIFDFAPPLASLPSGVIATMTFTTANVGATTETAVTFSADPPVSFGSNTGQSIPGTTTNGTITIVPPSPELVAEFSATPLSGEAPLSVNFTDESIGNPTSWLWDFGDGGSATSQNPNHTYTSAGTYTVKLTISKGADSDSEIKTNYITVIDPGNAPDPDFEADAQCGPNPLTVQFTDLSTNNPTSWLWNFGDGSSSTSQNPNHTYTAAGTYTVSLTATNNSGSNTATKPDFVTVKAICADFSATPTSGTAPLAVQFTDLSTGNPTSWLWDFGDGNSSTSQNPSHTYTLAGTYTVTLTASNGGGSDSETKVGYIMVTPPSACNLPVTAQFTAVPQTGSLPLQVQFSNESSNATSWLWNFGDGHTSTGQHPSHTYTHVGSYTVTLTATCDGLNDTETKSNFITVNKAKLFLPVMRREFPTAVFGRITNPQGQGVAGVVIATNTGKTAVSDTNGNYILGPLTPGSYTLIPNKTAYTFSPSTRSIFVPPNAKAQNFMANSVATNTPTPTNTPQPGPTNTPKPPNPTPTNTPQPSCWNGIGNGSFESSSHWVIGNNEYPASYSTVKSHGGSRSLRVGITSSADNQFAYSSVAQTLTIPSNATDATLRFWLYTNSSGTLGDTLQKPAVVPTAANQTSLNDDAQYVLVYDGHGTQYTLLFQRTNQGWTQYQANLGSLAGQQITLYFGVYNNGFGGVTGMYVDDVELTSCR